MRVPPLYLKVFVFPRCQSTFRNTVNFLTVESVDFLPPQRQEPVAGGPALRKIDGGLCSFGLHPFGKCYSLPVPANMQQAASLRKL
jgi:hypothetical protein